MTTVDVSIVLLCLVLAVFGWRQGLVVGALSLVGFAVGAYAGTRAAAALFDAGSASPYGPLFGLLGAVLVGGALSAALEIVGHGLRRAVGRIPGVGPLDGALGAGLGVVLALGLSWVAGAVALQTPEVRGLRTEIQRSEILSRLNDALPPSGPLLNAIARFDPFPTFDGPAAEVAAPPPGIARDPEVRGAAASVVRITGTACGLGVEGSGWVARGGVVVTNAHVIAGEQDTTVQARGTGPRLSARVVLVDAVNDLAVLRVDGLGAPPLALADATAQGTPGAVLGFPRNGPHDVRAARIGVTRSVLADDAYGDGPVRRRVTAFRALVRPGNSGGPVVDGEGRVLATVFAAARDAGEGPRTGYGIPVSVLRDRLDSVGDDTVDPGPCAG